MLQLRVLLTWAMEAAGRNFRRGRQQAGRGGSGVRTREGMETFRVEEGGVVETVLIFLGGGKEGKCKEYVSCRGRARRGESRKA